MKFKFYSYSSIFVLLIFLPTTVFGQFSATGEISGTGFTATGDTLPFWQYTNTRGRISEETNSATLLNAEAHYLINPSSGISGGAGFFFNDALAGDQIRLDELYLSYHFNWLGITAGRKQEEELYSGLSATNENILWSLNARPLPGINIGTTRPVFFTGNKKWAFEAEWAEYLLANDRYIQNARLHHKSIALNYIPNQKWHFRAGIQHFAQWAGTSPNHGKQPKNFQDYLRVFAGREGGETALGGDQINVLGNHLGSYELYITKIFLQSKFTFLFNSIFEDGSGSRGANFPDGRYGLYYENFKKEKWINGLIYELYYTKNMSQTGPHLYDSYFNNDIYASGWTNNNRVIGVPYMTTNYYEDYPLGTESIRVGNNSVLVHHLGISGAAFKKYPFKILASYRNNYGHYRNTGYKTFEYYPSDDPRGRYKVAPNILSTFVEFKFPFQPIEVNLQLAGDFSKEENTLGAGLNLKYNLNY